MEEVGRGDQGCDNRNLSCGSTMLLLLLLLDLRILGASDVCILLDKPMQNTGASHSFLRMLALVQFGSSSNDCCVEVEQRGRAACEAKSGGRRVLEPHVWACYLYESVVRDPNVQPRALYGFRVGLERRPACIGRLRTPLRHEHSALPRGL